MNINDMSKLDLLLVITTLKTRAHKTASAYYSADQYSIYTLNY